MRLAAKTPRSNCVLDTAQTAGGRDRDDRGPRGGRHGRCGRGCANKRLFPSGGSYPSRDRRRRFHRLELRAAHPRRRRRRCASSTWTSSPTPATTLDPRGPRRQRAAHVFVQGDICDAALLPPLFADHRIDAVVHFAAESHVDRSIDGPEAFLLTNVLGTFRLLDAARGHWKNLRRGAGGGLPVSSTSRPTRFTARSA